MRINKTYNRALIHSHSHHHHRCIHHPYLHKYISRTGNSRLSPTFAGAKESYSHSLTCPLTLGKYRFTSVNINLKSIILKSLIKSRGLSSPVASLTADYQPSEVNAYTGGVSQKSFETRVQEWYSSRKEFLRGRENSFTGTIFKYVE